MKSTARRPGELIFILLLAAGSAFMLWQAYGISRFESISSAGIFPMLATSTMIVTSLLALNGSKSHRSSLEDGADGSSVVQKFVQQITPVVFLRFLIVIVAYMALLDKLGFLLSSYLFLVVSMRLLGSLRWRLNLLVSGTCLVSIYLIFQTAFTVVLPKASLFSTVMP